MKTKSTPNIYKQAQRFANLTKTLIATGKINRAKRCFLYAENAFIHGTSEIKNLISNVYLYSVSSFMEINHYNFQEFLPENLKNEYHRQVNASGL